MTYTTRATAGPVYVVTTTTATAGSLYFVPEARSTTTYSTPPTATTPPQQYTTTYGSTVYGKIKIDFCVCEKKEKRLLGYRL